MAAALPAWLDFRTRLFPSCNFTFVGGPRPVLVDSGFGSDLESTLALLPEAPALLLNTHWHSDHVGGNAGVVARTGAPVAASAEEGARVNAADPEACAADFLDQPVDRYRVERLLEPGDRVDTGAVELTVIAAGGHSRGQIALFEERSRVLIAGDCLLAADVPWINPFLDGEDALAQAIATVERVARLEPRLAVAGHGPVIEDVPAAAARTLERMHGWRRDPSRLAFHGGRRILGYALMIRGGIGRDELTEYLVARRWVRKFAPLAGTSPEGFAGRLVSDLLGSGGACWEGDRLLSAIPHTGRTMAM